MQRLSLFDITHSSWGRTLRIPGGLKVVQEAGIHEENDAGAPQRIVTDDPDTSENAATEPAVERRWDLRRRLAAARKLWRAEFFFLNGLALFSVLAIYARAHAWFAWDKRIADAVQSISLPGTGTLMRAGSFFADGWNASILTAAALILFLTCGRRTEAAGLMFSTAGGTLLNRLMKYLIARRCPTFDQVRVSGEWAQESFPSGHVTFYVCFFGFLFFVAYALFPKGSFKRRAVCSLAALPVLIVGFSRVYLGAHWPSDTLGAYLLSSLWLAVSLHRYRRWKKRSTFHQEQVQAAEIDDRHRE